MQSARSGAARLQWLQLRPAPLAARSCSQPAPISANLRGPRDAQAAGGLGMLWRRVVTARLLGRRTVCRWHSVAATDLCANEADEYAKQARLEIGASRRVVVKMGTAVVTHDGVEIALGRVTSIVEQLAHWHRRGLQPVLVSSGSIGLGATDLGLSERPRSLGMRQACAAVGQGHLINFYRQAFGQLGIKVAQVLLTNEDLADRDRALCFRTTMLRLIELGVVPILNENDSVSVRELLEADGNSQEDTVFGDNDGLSARVATSIDADLLVLLTDVDGVFNRNPTVDPTAKRFSNLEVDRFVEINTEEVGEGTSHGTGGMGSKVDAAVWACNHGVTTLIANGRSHGTLQKAMVGEDVGTVVLPSESQRESRRVTSDFFKSLYCWCLGQRASRVVSGKCNGAALVISTGASAALCKKSDSLLPDGVIDVIGEFEPGDVVELRDKLGIVLGRGLVNYRSSDCKLLAGKPAKEIGAILGWRGYDELIGREHMVLADRLEDELLD